MSYDMISTHTPREGCDKEVRIEKNVELISTHTPREGCDRYI